MRIQFVLLLALLGCAPEPASRFSIAVHVESDPGVPLAGAQLRANPLRSLK